VPTIMRSRHLPLAAASSPGPYAARRGRGNAVSAVGVWMGIPKRMTITDASGAEVASLRAKTFSPIKSA